MMERSNNNAFFLNRRVFSDETVFSLNITVNRQTSRLQPFFMEGLLKNIWCFCCNIPFQQFPTEMDWQTWYQRMVRPYFIWFYFMVLSKIQSLLKYNKQDVRKLTPEIILKVLQVFQYHLWFCEAQNAKQFEHLIRKF